MKNALAEASVLLADEAATLALGQKLGQVQHTPAVIFLQGPLGAGKTTLVRGILRGWGYEGRVKSPTYTLVEPYDLGERQIFHFDLYRLGDPAELEYLGFREFFHPGSLCLIEWPERGEGMLPDPDLSIELQPVGQGREVSLRAANAVGQAYMDAAVAT